MYLGLCGPKGDGCVTSAGHLDSYRASADHLDGYVALVDHFVRAVLFMIKRFVLSSRLCRWLFSLENLLLCNDICISIQKLILSSVVGRHKT